VALMLLSNCANEMAHARLAPDEPTYPREASEDHTRAADCVGYIWNALIPGLAQLCIGETAEGAMLLTIGSAEIAVGTAVAIETTITHPGAALPLIAAEDLAVYSYMDAVFRRQRAERMVFVPQDSMGELIAAPFNLDALSSTDVWLGILGSVAAGLAVSYLTDPSSFQNTALGAHANIFGASLRPAIGYPLGVAIGVGLFEQVAIAEESLFRGAIQSGFARNNSETAGWVFGSLIFGGFHATNALFLPSDQQLRYLAVGVPFITLLGGYLGLSYRWHDYSLVPSTAIHFWYDLLISAVPFFLNPTNSPLSASIAVPF
jgi:membrane protease YdiL (CAAX protease family)